MRTGTNLEDEDVLAKNVMDINGRTVMPFHSLCVNQGHPLLDVAYCRAHIVLLLQHMQEAFVGYKNTRPCQVLC